eukprot:1152658-Pelagomonas_calceolata.AAC.1
MKRCSHVTCCPFFHARVQLVPSETLEVLICVYSVCSRLDSSLDVLIIVIRMDRHVFHACMDSGTHASMASTCVGLAEPVAVYMQNPICPCVHGKRRPLPGLLMPVQNTLLTACTRP